MLLSVCFCRFAAKFETLRLSNLELDYKNLKLQNTKVYKLLYTDYYFATFKSLASCFSLF